MTSLNLSTNGPSISKSYQSVVNAPPPSGSASTSPTYGQWAVFSVTTPLVNAFQQEAGGKESVLKVQSTGEGELVDLIDEFSDGRVQFAFVKVKDPNTSLPKHILIGWCGEGVPERTKGYFASYQAATAKVLHGYHVQITARSDSDLSPEGLVQKVADASGSKYSASTPLGTQINPTPVASKPAFMPTSSSGAGATFNPLSGSNHLGEHHQDAIDKDGWGEDAPQITRTQLEKVAPAYKPTRVNIAELSRQDAAPRANIPNDAQPDRSDVIKGHYQPIGKVDISAIRKDAHTSGSVTDDRPTIIKGAYEPVGKVDIAAIRARAQQPSTSNSYESATPPRQSQDISGPHNEEPKSLAHRTAVFSQSDRLTSLPKPKISNRFSAGSSTFAGTKAPVPEELGFESKISPKHAPLGASRTFADRGGKTPAQLWAEKKAKQGIPGASAPGSSGETLKSPNIDQSTKTGDWKSGYTGKTWAPVSITKTGTSASIVERQSTGQQDDQADTDEQPLSGGIGSIRNKFNQAPVMGAGARISEVSSTAQPPLDTSTKPSAGREFPGPAVPQRSLETQEQSTPHMPVPPPPQPRSPTPPTQAENEESPIRIAMPIPRDVPEVEDAHEEQTSPPPLMPIASLTEQVSQHDEPLEADEPDGNGAARAMATHVASSSFDPESTVPTAPRTAQAGKRAVAQYDYEKAEANELELREGEHVTNIEMVDEDWWMGQNSRGETGLFPSNYVELVEDDTAAPPVDATEHQEREQPANEPVADSASPAGPATGKGLPTATALYDYEAGEENELTFPEGAKITSVDFPDDDWWSGEYGGNVGLFPANYVELDA